MGIHSVAVADCRQRSAVSSGGVGGPRCRLSVVALLVFLPWHALIPAFAQVVGDHAEMERLRVKADEAIANGDPDGAAMTSGKAAMMAAHLAKVEGENPTGDWYHGAEALFRSQEHAYRAMALFQRAGGHPPASTGVCRSMQLANQESQKATLWLGKRGGPLAKGTSADPPLSSVAVDWQRTLQDLNADFQCP